MWINPREIWEPGLAGENSGLLPGGNEVSTASFVSTALPHRIGECDKINHLRICTFFTLEIEHICRSLGLIQHCLFTSSPEEAPGQEFFQI